jgi:hypothetical protein
MARNENLSRYMHVLMPPLFFAKFCNIISSTFVISSASCTTCISIFFSLLQYSGEERRNYFETMVCDGASYCRRRENEPHGYLLTSRRWNEGLKKGWNEDPKLTQ